MEIIDCNNNFMGKNIMYINEGWNKMSVFFNRDEMVCTYYDASFRNWSIDELLKFSFIKKVKKFSDIFYSYNHQCGCKRCISECPRNLKFNQPDHLNNNKLEHINYDYNVQIEFCVKRVDNNFILEEFYIVFFGEGVFLTIKHTPLDKHYIKYIDCFAYDIKFGQPDNNGKYYPKHLNSTSICADIMDSDKLNKYCLIMYNVFLLSYIQKCTSFTIKITKEKTSEILKKIFYKDVHNIIMSYI